MSMRKPAIVIVEDEPDVLLILHQLLRDCVRKVDEDIEIMTYLSGAEALRQLSLRQVPLVITDYKMPGMDGLELTAKIKEQSPHTFVVLVTAYATPELEIKARQAGADYYLPKPFPRDQFEQIIDDVLRGREAQRLHELAQRYYLRAGSPYGTTTQALLRWLEEQLER